MKASTLQSAIAESSKIEQALRSRSVDKGSTMMMSQLEKVDHAMLGKIWDIEQSLMTSGASLSTPRMTGTVASYLSANSVSG